MMPAGSYERISSRLAVHGTIALNTCCSRMRRAISCVYCPPKSSTTTPPSSDFGLVWSFFTAASGVITLLGNDKIQQFILNVNNLNDALSSQVSRDRGIGLSHRHNLFLADTSRHFQLATQFATDLHGYLDVLVLRELCVGPGPADCPQPV